MEPGLIWRSEMANYGAIAPSETAVKSPYTASLADRFAQNPVAIAEGAAGAPKIVPDAVRLVLDDLALSDVGNGIGGISTRLAWLWVDFGWRYHPIATACGVTLQARTKLGAAAWGAYFDIVDPFNVPANALNMFSGGLWIRPDSGSWRCTLGGKSVGGAGAFSDIQLRLQVSGGAVPTLLGGRMMFTGLHSLT